MWWKFIDILEECSYISTRHMASHSKDDNLQFSLKVQNLLTFTYVESHVNTVVNADILPYLC